MRKKIFIISYIVVIILFVISWIKIRELPKKSEIVLDLYNSPIQTETERKDFSFSYRKKDYTIKPVADYELWGLIVSKNNINAWYNFYHDKNTVNIKDICVIWGKNIQNEMYRDKKINFSSGEWTCYVHWSSGFKGEYHGNNLSNNHLLTANTKIQEKIRNLNIGDQVYFKGSLVNYAEKGQSQFRSTSTVRDDHGCEIVYLDEFKIYKKNNEFWHFLYKMIKIVFAGLVITQVVLYIKETKEYISDMSNQNYS